MATAAAVVQCYLPLWGVFAIVCLAVIFTMYVLILSDMHQLKQLNAPS
jgi:hypothetical protein